MGVVVGFGLRGGTKVIVIITGGKRVHKYDL